MQAMSALLQGLDRLPDIELGTVVHVNPADDDVIGRYAKLGAHRVVLVSADPDVLTALRRAARGHAGIRVVEAAIAPQVGRADWLRQNVRELSGLLPAGDGLIALYPRLRVLDRLPLVTMTLQSVLEQVGLTPVDPALTNLLVLETPGMEAALLQGISQELLAAFGLLLLRGAAPGLFQNTDEPDVALRWLDDRFYRRVAGAGDAAGLWPVALMRHDDRAAEKAAAARRIDELLGHIEQLGQAHDERARALAAGQAQAEVLAQERLAQVELLSKARDEQARLASDRQHRIVELENELTDLTARQGMLRDELIKAEAHVELISDLMRWETAR